MPPAFDETSIPCNNSVLSTFMINHKKMRARKPLGPAPLETLDDFPLDRMSIGGFEPFAQAHEGFMEAIKPLAPKKDAHKPYGMFCGQKDGVVSMRRVLENRRHTPPQRGEVMISNVLLKDLVAQFGYEIVKQVLEEGEMLDQRELDGEWTIAPTDSSRYSSNSDLRMNITPTDRSDGYNTMTHSHNRFSAGGSFNFRKKRGSIISCYGNFGRFFVLRKS